MNKRTSGRQVTRPKTASPARDTHALPGQLGSAPPIFPRFAPGLRAREQKLYLGKSEGFVSVPARYRPELYLPPS